jgi:hypothetical protein
MRLGEAMAEYSTARTPPSFDTGDVPVGGEIFKAGVISGLIGGVLMAVWAMISTTAQGLGAFAVLELIGAAFRGPEALIKGPFTLVFGIVLHLVVASAFGVLFATLVRRDTPATIATIAGFAYGLGLFVLMSFVVVPVVDPVMSNRVSMMIGTVLTMHVLYGFGVGLAPRLRREFARAAERDVTS